MSSFEVPRSPFPVLPMRHGVVFPGTAITVPMGRRQSLDMLPVLHVSHGLEKLVAFVAEAHALEEVRSNIDNEVRREIGKGQRDAILRQQLRASKRELGDEDGEDDLAALKEKLDAAGLP